MSHGKASVIYGTVYVLISFYLYNLIKCEDSKCVKLGPCLCQFPNGSRIDLTSVGFKNGSARFLNFPSIDNYTYSYNPCYGFSLGDCIGVAACQKNIATNEFFSLGLQDTAIFYMNGTQLTLNYTATLKTTSVKLICDSNGNQFQADGEPVTNFYSFTLRSPCACPNGCLGAASPDAMSTGSILVLLLFIFVLVYLVGGMIFKKIVVGATGKELIPNYDFWMDFPLLVRDGVTFVCNGCQNEASYDRI